jgi:hypothetical protein
MRQELRPGIRLSKQIPRGVALVLAGVILSAVVVTRGQSPGAQDYKIVTLDVSKADRDIQLTQLNNEGLFVEQYQSPVGAAFPLDLHGAVFHDGAWTVIEVPGAVWSGPSGVNSHGQIALTFARQDGVIRMAIWQHRKKLVYLPEIPGFMYGGNGFNDRGEIAGNAFYPDGSVHGFLGNNSSYQIFDYPSAGLLITVPGKINNAGILVGEYDATSDLSDVDVHAFLKEGDEVINLDLPATEGTSAVSINNRGVIVGYFLISGKRHGFIRRGERWKSFDVPRAEQTWLTDINDHGQLAGVYRDPQGVTHGYMATPLRRN